MENNNKSQDTVYSNRLKAGKRRTYFFDVRSTKNSDYYLTITESRKRFDNDEYERHKVFVYKEDINKFLNALNETVKIIKTELLPNYDFDSFNHDNYNNNNSDSKAPSETEVVTEVAEVAQTVTTEPVSEFTAPSNSLNDSVDKW
jgi:hypothetical protein